MAQNGGVTCLMAASITKDNNHKGITQMLLEKGADVNRCDINRSTALHYAAQKRCTDIAQLLLEYGGDPSLRDSDGNDACDVARLCDHKELFHILKNICSYRH